MLAVPALALAGQWPPASGLVVAERVGRGIRKPTVEAMLSYAGKSIGAGWVFGLNEALDQAGATIGPLLVALILYLNHGFRTGFGVLLIPATERRRRTCACDEEFDARLVDLSRGRRAYRRWVCRFRADRFSFS